MNFPKISCTNIQSFHQSLMNRLDNPQQHPITGPASLLTSVLLVKSSLFRKIVVETNFLYLSYSILADLACRDPQGKDTALKHLSMTKDTILKTHEFAFQGIVWAENMINKAIDSFLGDYNSDHIFKKKDPISEEKEPIYIKTFKSVINSFSSSKKKIDFILPLYEKTKGWIENSFNNFYSQIDNVKKRQSPYSKG